MILQNLIDGGFPARSTRSTRARPSWTASPACRQRRRCPSRSTWRSLPSRRQPCSVSPRIAGGGAVKALVVIAAGLSGPARAELLEICRRHSMRMVGPASFGVASPGIGLDATFAARHPAAGTAGLAFQSTGGTGFVLVEHLSRLGVGISTLVSLGDKDDVSGTDMLQWWESDEATKLALLYLESIGNPPKFARTARRVSRIIPVLTVDVGRSAAGKRLAGARAVKAATAPVTRKALFEQAGIITVANLGELLDATALLASQPVPAGRPGRRGVQHPRRRGARR